MTTFNDWSFYKDRLNVPIECTSHEGEEDWWALETRRRRLRLELFDRIEDPEARIATLRMDAQLCAQDHIYWMENYAWMYDPKRKDPIHREIPVVLWPRQKDLIRWLLSRLEAGEIGVTFKGRELGVSYIHMLLIYNLFRSEKAFTALVGSKKEELVDNRTMRSLFGKLRFNHDRQPSHLKPDISDAILKFVNPSTGGELIGEATNPGFARGARVRVLFIDEFAHIEPMSLQTEIYNSITSVAPATWICSTPLGPGSKFSDLYRELPSEAIMEMDWDTDPRRDEAWKANKIKYAGEDGFEREYRGHIITMKTGRVWTFRRPVTEYHDDDPEWKALGPNVRREKMMLGGWDFGSGESLLVCLFAIFEMGKRPKLWIDDELTWQQTSWRIAAADALHLQRTQYGGRAVYYGDPAGRQRDSSQLSWETNLRQGGIPLFCLPEGYNRRDQIEWAIRRVQAALTEGTIRIHRRCGYLWTCIENWSRQIPTGVNPDYVSRAYIPPRSDVHSHGSMAMAYLVSGAFMTLEAAQSHGGQAIRDDEFDSLPKSPAGEMALTFNRMLSPESPER